MENNNTIGMSSLGKDTTGCNSGPFGITNSVFIGFNAGADITEGDGIVIIGDDIRSLNPEGGNCLFFGKKVVIGRTLFGKPINIYDIVKEHLNGK